MTLLLSNFLHGAPQEYDSGLHRDGQQTPATTEDWSKDQADSLQKSDDELLAIVS